MTTKVRQNDKNISRQRQQSRVERGKLPLTCELDMLFTIESNPCLTSTKRE